MNSESDESERPLFSIRCGNRDVFGIGALMEFREDEQLNADRWRFIAERAQRIFGKWPVYFLDRDDQQRQSKSRFTGYRIIANCSAFNPNDYDTIEKAILIWHQPSAPLPISDKALQQIADLDWCQFAQPTDY